MFIDAVWCLEIFLCFFKGNLHKDNTFPKTLSKYTIKGPLRPIGAFWFDIIATLPSMITKQSNNKVRALKILRLYHFFEMFIPLELLTQWVFSKFANFYRDALTDFVKFFASAFMLGHLIACLWCFLGKYETFVLEEGKEPELKTWIVSPENEFADKPWHYQYIFAAYWYFQTITTVGYGDLSLKNATPKEMWFVVAVEFLGLSFFSLLLGILNPIFTSDTSFVTFLNKRLLEIDTWTLKLEKSVPHYLPCGLYSNIKETVWVAMQFDHNILIEEFDFYSMLTPRLQTELVEKLFNDLIEQLDGFFRFCEIGFRNEFIINMLCRVVDNGVPIQEIRDKVQGMYFIGEGSVSMGELPGCKGLPIVQYKALPPNAIDVKPKDRPLSWFGDFYAFF